MIVLVVDEKWVRKYYQDEDKCWNKIVFFKVNIKVNDYGDKDDKEIEKRKLKVKMFWTKWTKGNR